MMGRRVRRGKLQTLVWSGRRGATAKAALATVPAWKPLGVGWRDKRGSVAIMTALLGTALIGFAALAVDVSVWEGNVGSMQGAADQAALAAGLVMSAGKSAARKEAKGIAAADGFVDGTGNVGVTVNIPPATGSYVSNSNAIEVVITQLQTTFLSGVRLPSPPVAAVRAVAAPTPASTCVLMLSPGQGIASSGTGGIDAGACNIYVNGTSACDVVLAGTTNITGFDVFLGETSQANCSAGSSKVAATNELHYGVPPALDPYASRKIPKPLPPCQNVNTSPSSITLKPGTYCGLSLSTSGSAQKSVTLESGVYVFDGGGLNISGNVQVNGSNVSLVFTSSGSQYGSVNVSGNSNINLTPMTSGVTAGIAIWLDKAGNAGLNSSGSNNLTITGAIYAPNAVINWSGSGGSTCTQLIASSMNISGSATFRHDGCLELGVADVASAAGYKLSE